MKKRQNPKIIKLVRQVAGDKLNATEIKKTAAEFERTFNKWFERMFSPTRANLLKWIQRDRRLLKYPVETVRHMAAEAIQRNRQKLQKLSPSHT